MYISCNLLRQYVKGCNIDWLKIWETFTTSTAEVENITIKGAEFEKILVAKVLSTSPLPGNSKYTVISLDIGEKDITTVTSATNIYVGMLTACCVVGGKLNNHEIRIASIGGVTSEGVLCSEKELGISQDNSGILELPRHCSVGCDIKNYLNLDDIIVEIDNKSLTNRPDLWGHYGIAREVCALTGEKIMPLETLDFTCPTNGKPLNLNIDGASELINRYSAVRISGLSGFSLDLNMKIILSYCGIEITSTICDLCNYVMLELGQPLFAIRDTNISSLTISKPTSEMELEVINRIIIPTDNIHLTYHANTVVAIPGLTVAKDSIPKPDTNSIILESANYNAFCIRKSSLELRLRTEESNRYEKSLDATLTLLEIYRFLFHLSLIAPNAHISSNLVDLYLHPLPNKEVALSKTKLESYLGVSISDTKVLSIFSSLGMEATVLDGVYNVKIPSFRATKDISNSVDLIEEIARIYGYHNIEPSPLELPLSILPNAPTQYYSEYNLKYLLASKHNLHEVHTYLWYNEQIANALSVDSSECLRIVNATSNCTIRSSLDISLIAASMTNIHNYEHYGLFEIGTVYKHSEVKKQLGILLCGNYTNAEHIYNHLKEIVYSSIQLATNIRVSFTKGNGFPTYLIPNTSLNICVGKTVIGYMGIVNLSHLGKKVSSSKIMVICNIDFDEYLSFKSSTSSYVFPSKYPSSTLDYTFILNKSCDYCVLEEKILNYSYPGLQMSFSVIDTYQHDDTKNITVRFTFSHASKTLQSNDMSDLIQSLLNYFTTMDLIITK